MTWLCLATYQTMRSFSWGRGIISLISTDWWEKRTGQCIYWVSVSLIKDDWLTDRFLSFQWNSFRLVFCFCFKLTLCPFLCDLRNDWTQYHPHTNVLWLHYLCRKLLSMEYRSSQGKGVKALKEALAHFQDNVLNCGSATEVLQTIFKEWKSTRHTGWLLSCTIDHI